MKQEILKEINKYLDKPLIYVFGSRVNQTEKPYSDLDIAIDIGERIPLSTLAKLQDSFSNSNIPYHIDITDMHRTNNEFKNIILSTCKQWQ